MLLVSDDGLFLTLSLCASDTLYNHDDPKSKEEVSAPVKCLLELVTLINLALCHINLLLLIFAGCI